MFEASESLDPRLEARYAKPPLTEPFLRGELGLLRLVVVVLTASSVKSVRSEVDFRHLCMGRCACWLHSFMDLLEPYLEWNDFRECENYYMVEGIS